MSLVSNIISTSLAFLLKINRGKFIYVLKQQEEEGKNNKKNNAKDYAIYIVECAYSKRKQQIRIFV